MDKFQLTRKAMASLLLCLKNGGPKSPTAELQDALQDSNRMKKSTNYFSSSIIPSIFEKILKIKEIDPGFSLNDIVALGNQIQYTKFSSTAVQNWVKRDVKEILGTPQKGRKYSIDQMILLFIVEDLKTVLDFDSIRKCLNVLFNDPAKRTDDLINPVKFYLIYSTIYEDLKTYNGELTIEEMVDKKAKESLELEDLSEEQKDVVSLYIAVAALAVQASYIETIAKQFYNSTLFI